MRFKWLISLAVAAAVAAPAVLHAEDEKTVFNYAYVNMERIADEYVLFKEAQDTAKKKIEEARVEDEATMEGYQTKLVELEEKLEGPLTPEAKEETVAAYKATYEEALEFRSTALTRYKRIERDEFEPVYKNVYEKIESYAIKEDYEIIFDYSAILLYADEKRDITEDIVNELNEEAGISE